VARVAGTPLLGRRMGTRAPSMKPNLLGPIPHPQRRSTLLTKTSALPRLAHNYDTDGRRAPSYPIISRTSASHRPAPALSTTIFPVTPPVMGNGKTSGAPSAARRWSPIVPISASPFCTRPLATYATQHAAWGAKCPALSHCQMGNELLGLSTRYRSPSNRYRLH